MDAHGSFIFTSGFHIADIACGSRVATPQRSFPALAVRSVRLLSPVAISSEWRSSLLLCQWDWLSKSKTCKSQPSDLAQQGCASLLVHPNALSPPAQVSHAYHLQICGPTRPTNHGVLNLESAFWWQQSHQLLWLRSAARDSSSLVTLLGAWLHLKGSLHLKDCLLESSNVICGVRRWAMHSTCQPCCLTAFKIRNLHLLWLW